jgi:hypothetical protein
MMEDVHIHDADRKLRATGFNFEEDLVEEEQLVMR